MTGATDAGAFALPATGRRAGATAPLVEEELVARLGYRVIAGLDEAGRGSWAGPVAAAAVVLPYDRPDILRVLAGVRDSKLLTPLARARLYDLLIEHALAFSVALVPNTQIDQLNILNATREAMRRSLADLHVRPDFLLLDAVRLEGVGVPQWPLVGGDRRSLSVAAASILAKVARDRYMADAEARYPGFRFSSHKGYGTERHQQELQRCGPTDFHRQSFTPIRRLVAGLGI